MIRSRRPQPPLNVQLYYFLAILISLSFGSLPGEATDAAAVWEHFQRAAAFTAMVSVAWWVLCFLSVRLVAGLIDRGEVSCDVGIDWFDRHLACFRWFSLGLIVLCLGGFGLSRDLAAVGGLRHSLAAQSMVLLTPALAMLTGLWAAEYWFGVRIGLARRQFCEALRWIWVSMRCSVGWLLAPILAALTLLDIAGAFSAQVTLPSWGVWCVLIGLAMMGIPWVVRRVFPTRAMEDSTRRWIEDLTRQCGLRRCRIVMWNTGGRSYNAMIAGLFGRFRVLMISDRLIEQMPRPELAMVILHEVAHARRFHVVLRIAALIPVWIGGAVLQNRLGDAEASTGLAEWSAMIGAAVSLAGTVLVLRWVSYASEFDADATACRLAVAIAGHHGAVPASHAEAAATLATALRRVTADCQASQEATWLHPAIESRVARLGQLPSEDRLGGTPECVASAVRVSGSANAASSSSSPLNNGSDGPGSRRFLRNRSVKGAAIDGEIGGYGKSTGC